MRIFNLDSRTNICYSQAGWFITGGGGGGSVTTAFQTDNGIAIPVGGVITFDAVTQAGSSVTFSGAGSTVSLNVTDASLNTIIGLDAGNNSLTGTDNTGVGYHVFNALTSGSDNTALGLDAMKFATNAGSNSAFGYQSLLKGTSIFGNCAVGENSFSNLLTGANSVAIGINAGMNYTSSESSNICIGAGTTGTLGESNALHIGAGTGTGSGQLSTAYMSGINGNTALTGTNVVVINGTDQLGTIPIPQGAIAWDVIISSTFSMVSNNGYISNYAGNLVFTLPATSAVGDIIEVTSIAQTWTIAQGAGQQIQVGSLTTTSGTGGSVASTAIGDSIRMVCTVASTDWLILSMNTTAGLTVT